MNLCALTDPRRWQIMILLWLIVAFGGGTWYFKWVPDSYAATGDEQPFWVQVCLPFREIGFSLPNKQRQHRTLHIQQDVLCCLTHMCKSPTDVQRMWRI